jgi:glycine oxidase
MSVVVLGGGIIGSLIAYRLRQQGLEVTLLDAGRAGQATRASAGMLAPHAEGLRGELLDWAQEGLRHYPDLLAELEAASGVETPLALSGVWSIKPPVQGWQALRDLKRLPGGYLDPVLLLDAAQKAFVNLGGTVLTEEAQQLKTGWVHTASQRLAARQIIIACGAWSGRFGLEVRPLKGEALLLEAPPPPGPVFAGAGYALPRGVQVYLGATQRESWQPGVEDQGRRWLELYRDTHFPHLHHAPVVASLWGYRPAGPLTVGELEPGVLAATGHGRNGILLAPATARRITELVLKSWKT